MKYLLLLLILFIPIGVEEAAHNCPCGAACKVLCGGTCKCDASAEERVSLPNDGEKLFVTVFAHDEHEAKVFLANNPGIYQYKAGNHYNLYTPSNTLMLERFHNPPMPSGIVQYASGEVILTSNCPLLKRLRKDQDQKKEADPIKEDDEEQGEEEPSSPLQPSPWLYLGLAVLSVAGGAGTKLYEEIKLKG